MGKQSKKEHQKYYGMQAWRNLSLLYRSQHPICERCNDHVSEAVHHIKSFTDYGLSKAERIKRLLDPDNLMAVCNKCHEELHREIEAKKQEYRKNWDKQLYIRY